MTTHVVDVPSPRFPGLWQEGTKDGYAYTLFANGDAILTAGLDSAWQITHECVAGLGECTTQTQGTPPDAAIQVAEQLKQCLLDGEVSEPAKEPDAPPAQEDPLNRPSEETAPPQGIEACGVDTIDDENLTRKLQRILVLAGVDPGPVDGIPGAMTNAALNGVLGEAAAQLSTQDAIAALRDVICSDSEQ